MNICMVTNTYLPHVGGVAQSIDRFVQDLRHMGHRVLVIAPEYHGQVSEGALDLLRLPALQNFNGSDFSVRIPLPLVVEHEIEAFQPDIVHSHHPFLLGDTALRVARKHAVPLVFTHHTLYEQYTHYVPLDSKRLVAFVIHLATVYANLCQTVVAPSNSVAHLIRERGVTVPVITIPTGVDTEHFGNGDGTRFRREWRIAPDAFLLGHVGRLAPEKNLEYLCETVVPFLKSHSHVVFLVIGDGPSRRRIIEMFDSAGLKDRLVMTGVQTGNDLADAYAAMDLFAFSSLSETQGMVLAEAMAAGVPVVALTASGVRDILEDGYNGRMLPQSAPTDQFSAALHEAVGDTDQLAVWKKGAVETAARHSREKCARQLVGVYQDCIERGVSHTSRHLADLGVLDDVVKRIRTEWDLISAKVKSVVAASPHDKDKPAATL